MVPIMVAARFSGRRGRRISGIALDPIPDIETVALFTPDHSGESLALDSAPIFVRNVMLHFRVKLIRFRASCAKDLIKIDKVDFRVPGGKSQTDDMLRTGLDYQLILSGSFGAGP